MCESAGRPRHDSSCFDQAAAGWEDNPVRLEMAATLARAVADAVELTPSVRAMDFGCGTGLLGRNLCGKVASVLAVDTSSGMIEMLKKRIAEAGIANITAQTMTPDQQFPAGSLDVIFSAMVMHHVPDVEAQMARFHRWLAPGGQVALADLETEPGSFHGENPDVYHKGFDPAAFAAMAERAGFGHCLTRRAYTVRKPSNFDGELQDYPVFLLSARKPA